MSGPNNRRQSSTRPDAGETGAPPMLGNRFSMATVESTARLADRSIFVASDGSRFQLQRMSGQNEGAISPPLPPLPLQLPSSSSPPPGFPVQRTSRREMGSTTSSPLPPLPQQSPAPSNPQSFQLQRTPGMERGPMGSPPLPPLPQQSPPPPSLQQRVQLQRIPGEENRATTSPPLPPLPNQLPARSSPPQRDSPPVGGFSIRRRPLSNTSSVRSSAASPPESPPASPPAYAPQRTGSVTEARSPMDDITAQVGGLNINRFSATPFFAHSDGGVQAAETLTDPQIRPRYEPDVEEYIPPRRRGWRDNYIYSSPSSSVYGQAPDYSPDPNIPPPPSYGSYHAHQPPIIAGPFQPQQPQPQISPTWKEALTEYPTPATVSTPSPAPQPSIGSFAPYPAVATPDMHYYDTQTPVVGHITPYQAVVGPDTHYYDTQTPVVVLVDTPPPSISNPSDSSSMGRDNVLPGEDILFDGPVKSAQSLDGPYEEGVIKVFRNTLSNELRFHCKTKQGSETHWMKGTSAQLVPVYAYDHRFPSHVFIRDNERDKGSNLYGQNLPSNSRPSGTYQFAELRELLHFQAQLTGEKVVLDISSVRWVSVCRANSRTSKEYSGVRLQIWHESRTGRPAQTDQSSFVTAGTQLSGPLRDRQVPAYSRLIVFLGRLSEYITVFVTDDVEVEMKGSTSVKLKPRKYGGFNRRGSAPGVKAQLVPKKGSDAAGLDIHGQTLNAETEEGYDHYKTFEIEFESSPSQLNFIQTWNEVMEERRKQRTRLRSIQEEMKKETFSSKDALAIRM